jgi:hypothetical protein
LELLQLSILEMTSWSTLTVSPLGTVKMQSEEIREPPGMGVREAEAAMGARESRRGLETIVREAVGWRREEGGFLARLWILR